MNATQSVVKLIMQQQMKDATLPDTFMLEIMWLLAQLAQRGNGNIKQNQMLFLLLRYVQFIGNISQNLKFASCQCYNQSNN
jgi:hypothetical protein